MRASVEDESRFCFLGYSKGRGGFYLVFIFRLRDVELGKKEKGTDYLSISFVFLLSDCKSLGIKPI